MSRWLTTGEMIDRLKVGEVAESVEVPNGKNLLGEQLEYVETRLCYKGSYAEFQINSFTKHMKWRILPRYISFEKAMEQLKSGKEVILHHKNKNINIVGASVFEYIRTNYGVSLTFEDLLYGEWSEGE